MRVLFQGAGAIGIAGAALFGERHEVAVATRTPTPRARAAFPRRVSKLDPSQSPGRGRPDQGSPRRPGAGWSVNAVAATRRISITDWSGVLVDSNEDDVRSRTRGRRRGQWDLLVLTTRPGDLDEGVASAIRKVSPAFLAITSQVEGDLDLARSLFPGTEVVIFNPTFLSERVDPSESRAPGREVRYWAPAGAPRFLIAGRRSAVSRLSRSLGPLVMPVPIAAVIVSPSFFIPYVAELSIRGGDWEELKRHLRRPTNAAAEAVLAGTGIRLPMLQSAARLIMETLEAAVPIDITEYAGRHFSRHEGQTLEMLEGWVSRAEERSTRGGGWSSALKSQALGLEETQRLR